MSVCRFKWLDKWSDVCDDMVRLGLENFVGGDVSDSKPEKSDAILEAAARRFACHGYRKTTLDDVAAELGMVKSAIYRYFPNKEALFKAAIDRLAYQLMEKSAMALRRGRDAEEQLHLVMRTNFDFMAGIMQDLLMTLDAYHELRPHIVRQSAKHQRSFMELIESVIEKGIGEGAIACRDASQLARVLTLALDNLHEELLLRRLTVADGHRHIDFLFDVIMNGIRRKG